MYYYSEDDRFDIAKRLRSKMQDNQQNSILSSIRPAAEQPYGESAHPSRKEKEKKYAVLKKLKAHKKWIGIGLGLFVLSFICIILFVPFSLKSRAESGQEKAEYEYGMELFYQERYQDAVEYLKLAAEKGYSPAAYKLGWYFKEGVDGSQDFERAEKYLTLAAENENEDALITLGKMYLDGDGVVQDYRKAFTYLYKSANLGNKEAAYHVAVLYAVGKGVEQNYDAAYKFAKKASLTDDNPFLKLLKEKKEEKAGSPTSSK